VTFEHIAFPSNYLSKVNDIVKNIKNVMMMKFIVEFQRIFPFPLVYSPLFCPPLPPRPFTPAGVKGSLNRQFGFFGPDAGVGAGACGAGWLA
jgi:hypothetical protein